VAMAHYLWQLGKECTLLNCEKTPQFFLFLDPDKKIQVFNSPSHEQIFREADGAIVVDISDWKRLDEVGKAIKQCDLPVACVDHHIPTDEMGAVQISDQKASSTGELLFEFFKYCDAVMSPPIVEALYTCILTDTGSFRFSNTTPKTHLIAAELIELGVNFRKVYQYVYESYSPGRSLLMGHLLANMHFEASGKMAWFILSQDLLKTTSAELWEIEGFSELPRSIKGVEISVMFTETPDGFTKASFRSKGNIPINGLANKYGGGGHKYASGALITETMSDVVRRVVRDAIDLVNDHRS
jgi:phosphoesterase RecJ-like protein